MALDFSGPGGTWAGGPSSSSRVRASAYDEHGSLITSYQYLSDVPDPQDALTRLRRVASLVRPIMRARGWKVNTLSEFLPSSQRLLGLNINHGQKICIRLRYTHAPATFLPIEECVDTMLHELCHIVHGPHDGSFHALWEELRDEHEALVIKGFSGESFLSKGHRLGGNGPRMPRPNAHSQSSRQESKGRRLGGERLPLGHDRRRAIANSIEKRLSHHEGCASGTSGASELADRATEHTIKTRADQDDDVANDRAIAEALAELMAEEGKESTKASSLVVDTSPLKEPAAKRRRLSDTSGDDFVMTPTSAIAFSAAVSAANAPGKVKSVKRKAVTAISRQDEWSCDACTCINPAQYLACDACGLEKFTAPQIKSAAASLQKIEREAVLLKRPTSAGWECQRCSLRMAHKWWTCEGCGTMKGESRVNEHVL